MKFPKHYKSQDGKYRVTQSKQEMNKPEILGTYELVSPDEELAFVELLHDENEDKPFILKATDKPDAKFETQFELIKSSEDLLKEYFDEKYLYKHYFDLTSKFEPGTPAIYNGENGEIIRVGGKLGFSPYSNGDTVMKNKYFPKFNGDVTKFIEPNKSEKTAPEEKFEGKQDKGPGKLYEYFTPLEVCEKAMALAYHYGFTGGKILDPAIGSGRLLAYAPKSSEIVGFEINKENADVSKTYLESVGFKNVTIYNDSFEIAYLTPPRYNSKYKSKTAPTWMEQSPFDLVIANPPYGKFTGLYKTHFKFSGQFEHFFIEYSMKLAKAGGLGIFVVPSSFMRNGNTYNDVKERIFKESSLVDAYRLPANIFKHTQIGTDILVLRKK